MKHRKSNENYEKLYRKLHELNTSDERNHKLIERDIHITEKLLGSESRAEHITASKKYLIDNSFSRNPTAICGCLQLGLPVCESGEGNKCYQKKACEFMTKLDGSGEPASDGIAKQMMAKTEKAYKHSSSKYDQAELSRYTDEMAHSLVLIEGKKLKGEEI